MPTPTEQSKVLLRKLGFLEATVEHWIPMPGQAHRRDLWGFGDILATHPRDGINLIVQATVIGAVSSRLKKACKLGALAVWLRTPTNRFEVWGWSERGVKRIAVTGPELSIGILEQPGRRRREGRGLFDCIEKRGRG